VGADVPVPEGSDEGTGKVPQCMGVECPENRWEVEDFQRNTSQSQAYESGTLPHMRVSPLLPTPHQPN